MHSLKVLHPRFKKPAIHLHRCASNKVNVLRYLKTIPGLSPHISVIPSKYFSRSRKKSADALCLVDPEIAKDIAGHIVPAINEGVQVIADTSPGLALIANELLQRTSKNIRLYEQCSEFAVVSEAIRQQYPDRVSVYDKCLFNLSSISNQDKYDQQNRVGKLFDGVPQKDWEAGPAMTIIGYMPNRKFIYYYMRMLAMQTEIASLGRIQLFAIMRPSDYITLTASSEQNLHTYKWSSVLFQLLFKHELLSVYPCKAFLPWPAEFKVRPLTHYSSKIDVDKLYLVKINARRKLPVSHEDIMCLYFFIRQCFGSGRKRIIPTVEKWIPGCGMRFIAPSKQHQHYYPNMGIFTMFGQLTPQQILSVFLELIEHPEFAKSSFLAMMQSELMQLETRESDSSSLLDDNLDAELESMFE